MSTCIDPEWLARHAAEIKMHNRGIGRCQTKRGYPAVPGSGPRGETCGTCGNLCGKHMAKTYYKCVVMKAHWTGGGGTDVKVKSAACSYWKPKVQIEGTRQKTEQISVYVR